MVPSAAVAVSLALIPKVPNVVTLQKPGGCTARPLRGHAVAGWQGACPAAPPAQKKPAGQSVGVADVAPDAHPYPGAAAAQGVHAADVVAFTSADHAPAAHGVGDDDPAGQKKPGGQAAQIALDAAPSAAEKVPPGQAVAFTDAHGQKEPGGQATGAPEAQKKDAGQGVHVRLRSLRA